MRGATVPPGPALFDCARVTIVTPALESTLTCPHCGFTKLEIMQANACQFFYTCERCKAVLRPKPGDCCVFCSFGSMPCPSVQARMSRDP